MSVIIWYGIFFLCAGIQIAFLYIVFGALGRNTYKNTVSRLKNPVWPEVSICIIVKNEKENLQALLPALLSQYYDGEYDIHIVDDHSTDGTEILLKTFQTDHPIKVYHHLMDHSIASGKKYALAYALTIDMKPILLMTDADCRPESVYWIKTMTDTLSADDDMVLGYSPYVQSSGTLNAVIQIETTYTALFYLGMAMKGHPYMGVGRNIMYRKSTLNQSNNLYKYHDILSGDDDLTINELGRHHHASIQFSKESRMTSIPKTTWLSWIHQKSRHVSTAKYYHYSDRFILMLFYSSLMLTWVIPFSLMFFSPWIGLIFIGLKWIYYLGFTRLTRKIVDQNWTFGAWLLAEGLYILSLIYLSPVALIKNTKKW